jgi:hypothetical protein
MNDPYPVGSDHAGFALKEAVKGLSGASLRSFAFCGSTHLVSPRPTPGSTFWSSAVDSRVAVQGHFQSSADASGRVAARNELTFLPTSFWSFM